MAIRRPGDLRLARKLRAEGVVYPLTTIWEARRAKLPLSYALALLEKESGLGHNEFGHDPTIFAGAGEVTKTKYLAYRAERRASGNRLMQGVGPTQLTFFTYQDLADELGGCWRPSRNMRVGFTHLQQLTHVLGKQEGAARFNGTGPAAEEYGRDFVQRQERWHAFLTR